MDEHSAQAVGEDALPSHAESPPIGTTRASYWFGQALIVVVVIVLFANMYVGGLALHVWTAQLFYKHWGGFWAIAAFLMPPFGELVACFTCLSWGVWFYWLAIALWLVSSAGGLFAEDHERRRALAILWLAAVAVLGGIFAHAALGYATAPTPLTPEYQKELAETATAVVAVLRASSSDDPALAASLPDAKESLRKRISSYDKNALDRVSQFVDAFLAYDRSLSDDMVEWLTSAERQGKPIRFKPSSETMAALEALPSEMHARLSDEYKEFDALAKGKAPDPTVNWREFVEERMARHRKIMAQVYADLLGRLPPRPLDGRDRQLGSDPGSPPL